MGIIRFLLAFLVLAGHVGGTIPNIGALAAVQAFFILSGVYMAAVYSTKYSKIERGQELFYINRALRLWPTYLVILAATAIAFLICGGRVNDHGVFTLFRTHDLDKLAYAIPLTLILFGQDLISLDPSAHLLLPVRQSWSIGTELLFYLVVPYVYGRRLNLWSGWAIVAGAFLLKIWVLHAYGWRIAYFFPLCNLGYFMLGCLVYHLGTTALLQSARSVLGRGRHLLVPAFVALAFSFHGVHLESGKMVAHFTFVALFCLILSLGFTNKSSRLDRYLGNISYGIYLNHFLVLVIAKSFPLSFRWSFLLIASASVGLSMMIEWSLQRPIDRFRERLTAMRWRDRSAEVEWSPDFAANQPRSA